METKKRKTKTSTAVKARYNKEHYMRISVQLETDLVIAFKEKCKQTGVSQAQIFRNAINDFLKRNQI